MRLGQRSRQGAGGRRRSSPVGRILLLQVRNGVSASLCPKPSPPPGPQPRTAPDSPSHRARLLAGPPPAPLPAHTPVLSVTSPVPLPWTLSATSSLCPCGPRRWSGLILSRGLLFWPPPCLPASSLHTKTPLWPLGPDTVPVPRPGFQGHVLPTPSSWDSPAPALPPCGPGHPAARQALCPPPPWQTSPPDAVQVSSRDNDGFRHCGLSAYCVPRSAPSPTGTSVPILPTAREELRSGPQSRPQSSL